MPGLDLLVRGGRPQGQVLSQEVADEWDLAPTLRLNMSREHRVGARGRDGHVSGHAASPRPAHPAFCHDSCTAQSPQDARSHEWWVTVFSAGHQHP